VVAVGPSYTHTHTGTHTHMAKNFFGLACDNKWELGKREVINPNFNRKLDLKHISVGVAAVPSPGLCNTSHDHIETLIYNTRQNREHRSFE